jgi:hypothetical protein
MLCFSRYYICILCRNIYGVPLNNISTLRFFYVVPLEFFYKYTSVVRILQLTEICSIKFFTILKIAFAT